MKTNNIILNSLILKFLERCGYQGIAFVIQLILARILLPSDYGVITMLTVFIAISQVFVQSGLNTALVQRKDTTEDDYTSVFWISLLIAVILYVILFFTSPLIASFYKMPELSSVLRVLALILIPGAFNSIQNAKVQREMKFKQLLYCTITAAVASGIVGITMAYAGLRFWALVGQQLTNQIVVCVTLMFFIKWHPRMKFNYNRIKLFFSFGWKLLVSALIDTVYQNLTNLVVGKKYDSQTLGFYNRGNQFPNLFVTNINGSIQSVMLPALSKEQDNKTKMKSMVRRSIVTSSYILFPLLMGLAVCAEPLISLLLTEKWLPCVPYLRIFCFIYAFWPIHTANLQAINALGRSDKFLQLEIIKKIYGLIALMITVFCFKSPMAIAIGSACTAIISSFVNAHPNKKLLNYSYIEQMKDILPPIAMATIMGAFVYAVTLLQLNSIITLLIQVLVGVIVYWGESKIFHIESYEYIVGIMKKKQKKEGKRMKKLLLLGGSAQQVVAIETAKRLGYYTILCDYLSDNPGQYVADKFYLESTTNKEKILEIAAKEKIDGIVAYASDPAAPTAAYVAEKLNLYTNPYESVKTLCNKDEFRSFLKNNGFNTPKSCGYTDVTTILNEITKFEFPVIIKPVDSSGSKGTTVLRNFNNIKEAAEFAFSFSRCKRVIVEEYIEKNHPYLIGGDLFVWNGKVILWGLMNCHRDNNVNPLVPVGKSYPPCISDVYLQAIKDTLQNMIDKLCIKSGAMNVELIVDHRGKVFPIDIGPRNGGNMIPDLLGYIFGINVVEMTIKAAMGELSILNISEPKPYYATHNLHSTKNGIYDHIEYSPVIEPYIIRKCEYKKCGDEIEYFDNASKALGIVFLKFNSEKQMIKVLDNATSLYKVMLKEEL